MKKLRLLTVVLILVLLQMPAFGQESGRKVSSWAIDFVNRMEEHISFVQDGDYTRPISRAEFAELSVNVYESLYGRIDASGVQFDDTRNAYVLKAKSKGLVNGISETEFNPEGLLTREQLATIIGNMDKATNDRIFVRDDEISGFQDADQIASWAEQSMRKMVANSMISGKGNGVLAPKDTLTIEEACTFMSRVEDRLNAELITSSSLDDIVDLYDEFKEMDAVLRQDIHAELVSQLKVNYEVVNDSTSGFTAQVKAGNLKQGDFLVVLDTADQRGIIGAVSKVENGKALLVEVHPSRVFSQYAMLPKMHSKSEILASRGWQIGEKLVSQSKINQWGPPLVSLVSDTSYGVLGEIYNFFFVMDIDQVTLNQNTLFEGRLPYYKVSQDVEFTRNYEEILKASQGMIKETSKSSFMPNPFTREFTSDENGYLDEVVVEFELSKDLLKSGSSVSEDLENDFEKHGLNATDVTVNGKITFEGENEFSDLEWDAGIMGSLKASNLQALAISIQMVDSKGVSQKYYDYAAIDYILESDFKIFGNLKLSDVFYPLYGLSTSTYNDVKVDGGKVTASVKVDFGLGIGTDGLMELNGELGMRQVTADTVRAASLDYGVIDDHREPLINMVSENGKYDVVKFTDLINDDTVYISRQSVPLESAVYGNASLGAEDIMLGPIVKAAIKHDLAEFKAYGIGGANITAEGSIGFKRNDVNLPVASDSRVGFMGQRYIEKFFNNKYSTRFNISPAMKVGLMLNVGGIDLIDKTFEAVLEQADFQSINQSDTKIDLMTLLNQSKTELMDAYPMENLLQEIYNFKKLPIQVQFDNDGYVKRLTANMYMTDFIVGESRDGSDLNEDELYGVLKKHYGQQVKRTVSEVDDFGFEEMYTQSLKDWQEDTFERVEYTGNINENMDFKINTTVFEPSNAIYEISIYDIDRNIPVKEIVVANEGVDLNAKYELTRFLGDRSDAVDILLQPISKNWIIQDPFRQYEDLYIQWYSPFKNFTMDFYEGRMREYGIAVLGVTYDDTLEMARDKVEAAGLQNISVIDEGSGRIKLTGTKEGYAYSFGFYDAVVYEAYVEPESAAEVIVEPEIVEEVVQLVTDDFDTPLIVDGDLSGLYYHRDDESFIYINTDERAYSMGTADGNNQDVHDFTIRAISQNDAEAEFVLVEEETPIRMVVSKDRVMVDGKDYIYLSKDFNLSKLNLNFESYFGDYLSDNWSSVYYDFTSLKRGESYFSIIGYGQNDDEEIRFDRVESYENEVGFFTREFYNEGNLVYVLYIDNRPAYRKYKWTFYSRTNEKESWLPFGEPRQYELNHIKDLID